MTSNRQIEGKRIQNKQWNILSLFMTFLGTCNGVIDKDLAMPKTVKAVIKQVTPSLVSENCKYATLSTHRRC